MRNMAAQVIEHKQIKTTVAKAKELRGYVDRLITYAKKGSVHHRRLAFNFLQDKNAVSVLFDEIAPIYEGRNGGYSRIIKLGNRKGDAAPISIFQLVGLEKSAATEKSDKGKKKKSKKEKTPEKEAAPEQQEIDFEEEKNEKKKVAETDKKETEAPEQADGKQ